MQGTICDLKQFGEGVIASLEGEPIERVRKLSPEGCLAGLSGWGMGVVGQWGGGKFPLSPYKSHPDLTKIDIVGRVVVGVCGALRLRCLPEITH